MLKSSGIHNDDNVFLLFLTTDSLPTYFANLHLDTLCIKIKKIANNNNKLYVISIVFIQFPYALLLLYANMGDYLEFDEAVFLKQLKHPLVARRSRIK